MSRPTLLVLAAGMGSRYGGLKQLDAVGPHGETIIDYSIFDAICAGFGKVVFVIRHNIEEAFKEVIGNRYSDHIQVEYAFQELDCLPEGFSVPEGREKPWGTGHAILVAKDVINEPFAVINADDFYGNSAYKTVFDYLCQAKDEEYCDYCMVGYQLDNTLSENGTVSRGVCFCDDKQNLDHVVETHGIQKAADGITHDETEKISGSVFTGKEIVSMNLWGFTPSIFEHLEEQFSQFLTERGSELKSEFYIPSVVNTMTNSGKAKAKVLHCDAQWFGVTYREDKENVEKNISQLVKAGKYPSPLWKTTVTQ